MKYVILNIDTECGGECWLQNVSSEEAIKENVGGYSSAEKTDIGVKFYNDDENEFTTSVLLNEKGLNELKEALNGANPFYPNKLDYKSWLNSVEEDDDE